MTSRPEQRAISLVDDHGSVRESLPVLLEAFVECLFKPFSEAALLQALKNATCAS